MEKDHTASFGSLPLELIEAICEYCDDIALLVSLPQVANVFWKITSSDNFWKRRSDAKNIKFIKEYANKSIRYNYQKNLEYYPDAQWSEIIGHDEVKLQLRECVLLPIKFPSLFTTSRLPFRVLLYGPTGPEKNMLVKALASEAKIPLFSKSCSTLFSMWEGDAERKIRDVFTNAKLHGPSILYFEDIDLLDGHPDGESESHRRIKTEFIVQCDMHREGIYVIAATDKPWKLAPMVRKRFERRLWVGLPDLDTRVKMLKQHLATLQNDLTEDDITDLGHFTTNYSSDDISMLVREVSMISLKDFSAATHYKYVKRIQKQGNPEELVEFLTPCPADEADPVPMKLQDIPSSKILVPKITKRHFELALNTVKRTVTPEELAKFEEFTENFVK